MIRTLMLLSASKLLCWLIYFFQIEIKLTYLPAMLALFVDFVNLYIYLITLKLSFHCNIYFCYVVGAIPIELVSILPHAGS